jgi:hypothetical protein
VTPRLAIVFCAHHKPWLMMGTLLTLASQEPQDADLFVAYNVGNGEVDLPSYREYRAISATAGVNAQLSDFDPRVRRVCQLRGRRIVEIEYENDHGLDSGVWYKFLRDGRWRDYDYVLFAGEGLLFADPRVLRALVGFADRRQAHFVASAHEKRRVPCAVMTRSGKRGQPATGLDRFHDRMIAETFDVFRRDPAFDAVYSRWTSEFPPETEHHVPGITPRGESWRRLRGRIQKRWGSAYTNPDVPLAGRIARAVPQTLDRWQSRARMAGAPPGANGGPLFAYPGGSYAARPVKAAEVDVEQGVGFHREEGVEWFGCTVIHLMSRPLLARLTERLERFRMYDALAVPFSGTALEIIWGFLPAWLGVDKWFTNGFHRVRKHFVTYQREDYPPELASYINRYHRGRLAADWRGDYLKLTAWNRRLGDLRQLLPAEYFL